MADQDKGLRKLKGALWELELALRFINPQTKKSHCICKCQVDKNDPTILCNKKLLLTSGSTTSLRHHIKANHPSDWAKVLKMESEKAEKAASNKAELVQIIAEAEGSIDDGEEDLATPGKKRPAPGERDLLETPKSKRTKPNQAIPCPEEIKFKKIITDVDTRWNSTLFLIRSVSEMRCALESLKEERYEESDKTDAKFKTLIPSALSFQIIEQIIPIMEKILLLSEVLSGDEKPTLHHVSFFSLTS